MSPHESGSELEPEKGRSSEEVRIGFAIGEWLGWQGGINYHANLLRAVAASPTTTLRPILFTGARVDESVLAGFPELPNVRSAMFDRPGARWAYRAVRRRVQRRDHLLERLLKEHQVSVLSHTTQAWETPDLAMIGWIADFQHRRLPDLFSSRERKTRDRTFERICQRSTLVIVSSETVRQDLLAFSPESGERARVLRFVAEPLPAASVPAESELAERYAIDRDYFYVPNQFWIHKNHEILVQALALLRERGVRPLVIATGDTRDYRSPGHFDSLMDHARRSGVTAEFRPVGVVPNRDVGGLMRGAVAIINPSRSEGWSTPVEEAKSLGKRVLLSDIEVHREQDPPGGVFFDPDDAEALAGSMEQRLNDRDMQADDLLERRAKMAFPIRQAEFAQTYEAIVHEALELVRSPGQKSPAEQ